jgi:pSer/pThr/pTyr-binding forkhead associated (FHA) protein
MTHQSIKPTTRICVTRGVDAGLRRDLTSDLIRIGTAPENDVVLTDSTVSLHHCEIVPTSRGLRVRDAGSGAGVFSGQCYVGDVTFRRGVKLELGQTSLDVTDISDARTVTGRTLEPGPARLEPAFLAELDRGLDVDTLRELKRLLAEYLRRGDTRQSPEAALALEVTASSPDETVVTPLRVARRRAADEFERSYVTIVLTKTDGNLTRAASAARVSRQMMQRLARKHGL